MLWSLIMEMLLTSSLVTAETLLYVLCQTFEYRDTLISQETINKHFSKLNGVYLDLDDDYKYFAYRLSELFESDSPIVGYIIYLRAGPQLDYNDDILRFPKIIARTLWQH